MSNVIRMCTYDNCKNKSHKGLKSGLCSKHYYRIKKFNSFELPEKILPKGIIKICRNHGELTKEKTVIKIIKNKEYLECHECVKSYHLKSYKKQRLIHEKKLKNGGYEKELFKKNCKRHGELFPHQIQIRGKYSKCRLCMNIQSRNYEKNNKERCLELRKRRYWSNPKKNSEDRVLSKRKLTSEQYYKMFEDQNYLCKACKKIKGVPISKSKNSTQGYNREVLVIDHCHISNKVRGLLCFNCNTILGLCKENIDTLLNIIEYMKEFKNDY